MVKGIEYVVDNCKLCVHIKNLVPPILMVPLTGVATYLLVPSIYMVPLLPLCQFREGAT